MVSRRAFLAGALVLASARLAAQDKPAAKTYRIGVLDPVAPGVNAARVDELRKGMKDLGYVEGQNLTIDYRSAQGRADRYPQIAAELARGKADLIVTNGTPATLAASAVPGRIPVVTAGVVDPVDSGLVASLERPGGKVTGLAILTSELEAKRIELLRALAPGRKRIAALINMGNPALVSVWKATEAAARSQGVEVTLIDVRKPHKFAKAFDAAAKQKADALVLRFGALAEEHRRTVVGLAAKHRLPAIYPGREFVELGGLMSYGVSSAYMYYRAAAFADRIFKGADPAALPMERPTKFEFVINRSAVRALGLVIPPDLLLRSETV